jgi:endonuclease/exonuclease/phosphatase family metal-dependent hydrolase
MQHLALLTLNIWNKQGPWPARLELIRDGLLELAPDIVGLQEVLRSDSSPQSQIDEITAGTAYGHSAYGSAWHIGGGLHLGNAVLSPYPVVDSKSWALPGVPGKEQHAVLYALVDAPCGRVPVFVTHLAWRLHHGHVRIEQVRHVAALVKQHAPLDGFPPVLMGDFNAEPDSDEMRYLRGLTPLGGEAVYFADCWQVCGDGPGHTWAADNPFAARTREPSRRIDYIYVRGPDRKLRGEPLSSRVVFRDARDGVFPSDHFGVWARIQAAPRPLAPY